MEVAACIIHIFVQSVELAYVDYLSIAFVILSQLLVVAQQCFIVLRVRQELSLDRGVRVHHHYLVQVTLFRIVGKSALTGHVVIILGGVQLILNCLLNFIGGHLMLLLPVFGVLL